MTLLWITLFIGGAGVLGGGANALLSDSGFFLPGWDKIGDKWIWKPGALVNMFLGGLAAIVSWGLYGAFAQATIYPFSVQQDPKPTLALATLVGAILVGMGGPRILTSEVEKRVLSATAATAATLEANSNTASAIATASSPTEALRATEDAKAAETTT